MRIESICLQVTRGPKIARKTRNGLSERDKKTHQGFNISKEEYQRLVQERHCTKLVQKGRYIDVIRVILFYLG